MLGVRNVSGFLFSWILHAIERYDYKQIFEPLYSLLLHFILKMQYVYLEPVEVRKHDTS